jgi:hypothetical protein
MLLRRPTSLLVVLLSIVLVVSAIFATYKVFSQNPISKWDLLFVKNGELWQRKSSVSSQLTNTSGTIYKFAYSDSQYAYISGLHRTNENNYSYIEPHQVFLDKTNVFSLEPTTNPNEEALTQLNDLAFSPDGSLLAITTRDEIILIDTKTYKPINTVNINIDSGEFGVRAVAVTHPLISPDNRHAFVSFGFIEGVSDMLIDLQTKSETHFGYNRYVAGSRVVKWLSSSSWLLEDREYIGESPGTSNYFKVSYPDLSKSSLLSTPTSSQYSHDTLISNDLKSLSLFEPGSTFSYTHPNQINYALLRGHFIYFQSNNNIFQLRVTTNSQPELIETSAYLSL